MTLAQGGANMQFFEFGRLVYIALRLADLAIIEHGARQGYIVPAIAGCRTRSFYHILRKERSQFRPCFVDIEYSGVVSPFLQSLVSRVLHGSQLVLFFGCFEIAA